MAEKQPDQSVQDLVASLLDCAATYPNVEDLKDELITSLRTISQHQPNAFLKACHKFLLENGKAAPSTKSFVLQSICQSVGDQLVLKSLDEQLVLLIINLVTQEITLSKDADVEFAESARDVLVALSRNSRFVANVVETVLQKFQPGASTSPHRYIVITMGSIAEHNPFGFVTFLTDILSRTVPLLPHIKTDVLRCAWARAICSFFEALRECETERPKEVKEDEDVNRPDSANEDYSDFQFVSNRAIYQDQAEKIYEAVMHWMYSKDAKARAESAECVGQLCLVIQPQKIIEDLKKLVTTILGLYRKAVNEQHMITKGLCSFLEAACADENCPLDAYLEDILNALFPNTCMDPEASTPVSPTQMRNHSEAFRCFTIAASRFADRIVYFLLHKMQNISDLQKLAAINVLRHLLNSSGVFVEDNRPLIMMGLKKLLASEQAISIKVRRSVVQLCIALSDHSYVDSEGGDNVIAFLVKNLVPPTEQEIQLKKLEVDVAGMNQLRTQCAQALSTIATTCNCATKLMWPYLLEFLCQERYTPAVGDLCKCLRILIQRESEAGRQMDYSTGFDNPLVAGRHAVLARLMVSLCNAPSNGLLTRRATEALGLIKAISPWFSEHIPTAIDKQVEKMESLLEELSSTNLASPSTGGSGQPLSELRGKRIARWHEASLELLSQVLTVVVDGGWRIELASAMGKQLDMYKDIPDEKAFLLRCLGTVLARITMKNFVVEHFMLMFKSTQHASTTERQGCARGVGAVAAVHTDLVLVELENVSKWEHAKKSGGFLGFIKDTMPMRQYPDAEMIYLRATLMLSYGYVVQNCPVDSLTQRLQQQILPFLRHYLSNPKQETVVREAMLETMRLIGWSVHSQRIGTEWKLDARNELLSYVKDYVQSESPEMLSSSLRLLACKATSALVQLDPPLSDNDIWDLCRILTQYIIPMYREKSGLKTLAYDLFDYATTSFNTFATSYNQQNHVKSQMRKIEDDESATIMEATVVQFGFTLEQIIRSRSTIATTTMLLKILQSYYGKTSEHERSRAVDATVLVLKVYHVHAGDVTIGHASDFPPLSSLLGRLSPRLTDSLAHVRMQSLAAIHWALKLAYLHKGHGQDYDPNLFSIDKFAHDHQLGGEGKLDGQVAKKVVKAMSEIIESYLPQSQMQTYLSALFEMLADRQSHVSSSAAQLLASSLAIRGATLHNEADTLVATLLQRLPEVHSCIQTYTDLLSALVAFAAHQQQVVCDVILKQPLPYTTSVLF
ncbi:hypothetical protein WR25_06739 isoform B [Diploscapter pachys]|uniref:Uncharacterized protein n=1 Tax=Diploscapter pachys TaxID=2018661 RepID=A0A2A2LXG1_9BILA|nr:hypothetical protein WR25_06739 isoform B [Diploscapter pachys]